MTPLVPNIASQAYDDAMTDLGPTDPFLFTDCLFVRNNSAYRKDSRNLVHVHRTISLSNLAQPRGRSSRFVDRAGESTPEDERIAAAATAAASCFRRVCFVRSQGDPRVFVVATSGSVREPLTNDAFFLFLFRSACLSLEGGPEMPAHGARYVTSRQRRSEHDDDASTLASSSPANWLHLRCLRASPSSSHPKFHQTRATDVELQLRPLATTTVANVVRWCWIGQQRETRA